MTAKTKRSWLVIPWTIFILLAVGWVVYWHVVANTAKARLAEWASTQQAAGAEARYSGVTTRGFPIMMRLEIAGFAYAPQGRGWSAATDRFDLHINPINPSHLIFEAVGPITLTHGVNQRSTLTGDALLVSMSGAGDRFRLSFEADDFLLDNPAQPGALTADKLLAHLRPDPRSAGDFQLSLEATALSLARDVQGFEPFGREIDAARAAIVITQGAAAWPQGSGVSLDAWRDAGGVSRFERLELTWGPLQANGQGEAALDVQRRLQGRLELNIPSPAPALQALSSNPNQTENARTALRVMGAGYAVTQEEFLADIDAQDGVLYVERLPVRQLSPLY